MAVIIVPISFPQTTNMVYKLPKDATPKQIENYKMINRINEASKRIAKQRKKK